MKKGETMIPETILNAVYVTVPYLQVREEGDRINIVNEVLGTSFTGPNRLAAILDFFKKPGTLKELSQAVELEFSEIKTFLENAFIINIDLLFYPVRPSIGEECTISDLIKKEKSGDIVVFGTPFDSASGGQGGARSGPREIRMSFEKYNWPGSGSGINDPFQFDSQPKNRNGKNRARPDNNGSTNQQRILLDYDMQRHYIGGFPKVVDLGNLRNIPGESVRTYGKRIHMITSLIMEIGMLPVLLGGDHSITYFVLQHMLDRHKDLGIIHFDAHPDLWPVYTPQFKYVTHGNPLLIATESKSMKHLLQVGLRITEWLDPANLRNDQRVQYVSARQVQHMTPAKVFEKLPRDIPYYLSFDIDCMSPYFAPETGTPIIGGLNYYQALDLVDFVSRDFQLVGADFVEAAGNRIGNLNHAADVAAHCVFRVFLGRVEFKPLESYVREHPFGKPG